MDNEWLHEVLSEWGCHLDSPESLLLMEKASTHVQKRIAVKTRRSIVTWVFSLLNIDHTLDER
jgi:trimethylamine:corrinoid methyltransferase-like protein